MKIDGEICGGVLVENASDDFPQQKKLENLLPSFAGSSPPISPKASPPSLWKSLVLILWLRMHIISLRSVTQKRDAYPDNPYPVNEGGGSSPP